MGGVGGQKGIGGGTGGGVGLVVPRIKQSKSEYTIAEIRKGWGAGGGR